MHGSKYQWPSQYGNSLTPRKDGKGQSRDENNFVGDEKWNVEERMEEDSKRQARRC